MKRLAIFVEGQTEQIFLSKLLRQIAGEKNISIVEEKHTIKKGKRTFTTLCGASNSHDRKYFVLIRDCGSDSCVKSDILETLPALSQKGYQAILGVLDVFPKTHDQIERFEYGLKYGVPTKGIPIQFILSIMEIESYFLAETSHFTNIDQILTKDFILSEIDFNPYIDNMEMRLHPSNDLNKIYKLSGKAYNKRRTNALRTIENLDYNNIYFDLRTRMGSLDRLLTVIDSFLV